MKPFKTIRGKLAFWIALPPIAIAAFIGTVVPDSAADNEKNALELRSKNVAAMLAVAVGPAVEFGQTDQVQSMLDDVARDNALTDLRWAAVYDASGRKLASIGDGSKSRLSPVRSVAMLATSNTEATAAAPMETQGQQLGSVAISLDAHAIAERKTQAQREIAFLASITTVLAIIAAWVLASRMGSIIEAMRMAAERIARGDVSEDLRVRRTDDELGEMADAFQKMNHRLRELQLNASRVAAGDLRTVPDDGGELFHAFRTMVLNLRKLASRIGQSSEGVAGAAAGLFAATREHEASATQQTASVEEMRRTLEALARSAEQVNVDALQVREMAERTLTSSQQTADQTKLVSAHSDRIGEILTLIQEIADKSDLLALNAALEGTKAGEVGRGFSLVAAEMRRLSEHVMDSVRDIRKLVADMRGASHASVLATEDSIKLARDAAQSATKISGAVSHQREGTGQVKGAADEIVRVVSASMQGTARITRSAEELLQLSHELRAAAGAFQLPTDGSTRNDDA